MMAHLIWNGTPDEFILLRDIVERLCKDSGTPCGVNRHPRCASHVMLVDTQRCLDDLLYGKRMSERFEEEEWRGK